MTAQFDLLFEGPVDDSAPTLRRIKGVFVADLDFPASDVQRFLENTPVTIKSADSESELQDSFNLLSKAGAKVLIVKSGNSNNSAPLVSELELEPLAFEFESLSAESISNSPVKANTSEEPLELSFDFDNSPASASATSALELEELKTASTPGSIREPKADLFGELSLDLSFHEASTEQMQSSTDKPDYSKQEDSGFDLSLSLEEKPVEAKEPLAKQASTSEQPPLDTGLELEVVTPANSTLFGQPEVAAVTTPEISTTSFEAVSKENKEPEKQQDEIVVDTSVKTIENKTIIEEEQIELTLEQLKILQRPPPKPFKLPIIPILLISGLGVLFYFNQLFFSTNPQENPFISMVEKLPKISTELDSKERAKLLAEKADELAKTSWYLAEQNFPNRSVNAKIWVEKKLPIHGSIEITTPEPAPLSKEEIVNGVSPRAWLRRLELKDLSFKNENSSMIAMGPALAYISVGEKNIRLSGFAILKASLSSDEKNIKIEAFASNTKPNVADTKFDANKLNFSIANTVQEGINSFDYSEQITLNRQ